MICYGIWASGLNTSIKYCIVLYCLCQKPNIPFAYYGSMQYFVEESNTESTCKQTNVTL